MLIGIAQLTPQKPANIINVNINSSGNLVVQGKNLPPQLTAFTTPAMHTQHAIISSRYTWSIIFDLALHNNNLWIANSNNGLISYDIEQPDNPIISGTLPLNGVAWRLDISGDKMFIARGKDGLSGVDISNPTAPILSFNKYTEMVVLDVATQGNATMAATAKNGVIFLDTSDLNNPKHLQQMALRGNFQTLTIKQNYLYVAGKDGKKGILYIIDINNIRQPKKIASIQLPGTAWSCAIAGEKLFLALGKKGLYSVDISNPTRATVAVKTTINNCCRRLHSDKNNLLIVGSTNKMYHYQNRGGILAHVKTFTLPDKCLAITSYKNLFITALSKKGFAIIEQDEDEKTHAECFPLPIIEILSTDIIHHGNTICVKNSNILHLLKYENSGTIRLYDSITLPRNIRTYAMDDNYAYVALTNNYLHIISLAPAEQQRTKNIIKLSSSIYTISVDEKNLYLAQVNIGLVKIKLEDINQPHIVTQTFAPSGQSHIIKENILYLSTYPSDFNIYQLSTDKLTTLLGQLHYPIPEHMNLVSRSLAIHKKHLFAANGSHGLLSIDISDTSHPQLCSSLDLGGKCDKIIIADKYAYVTLNNSFIEVVDISDPKKMRTMCKFPGSKAITAIDGKLLILNDNGITITPPPQPLGTTDNNANTVTFKLPQEAQSGTFDLQITTGQEIKFYNKLVQFSATDGWKIKQSAQINATQN